VGILLRASSGDIAPPWVVLGVGALQNAGGYLGTWLALTGRLPGVPLWAVMGLICCATNGATFFNTGGLVTCVKNFPASRRPIVGLLEARSTLLHPSPSPAPQHSRRCSCSLLPLCIPLPSQEC